MRTLSLPVLVVILALTGCGKSPSLPITSASAAPVEALPNFTELVKKHGPAVVNISTSTSTSTSRKIHGGVDFPESPELSPDDHFYEFFHRFTPGFKHEYHSPASGFIIDANGYILTNAHVVDDADEVVVKLTDKRELKAKILGMDRRSDIALLKISAKNLPVVTIGNSSKLQVGEWVVAIGSPFGFTNSISQGIVSAKSRSLPDEGIIPFIQTDVPINPGNSGGPLFNLNGEVVGINAQIYSRSGGYMGLSFAIPIDLAMKVKESLLKHGMVRRGTLGITIQNVTPAHAKSFSLDRARGALITSVEKPGPSDQTSLEIGDIVLKFNDHEITSAGDLLRTVADATPGTGAKILIWRNGAARELTVKPGEEDGEPVPQKPRNAEPGQLGLLLRELPQEQQHQLHTDGALMVQAVTGIAAESGMLPDDIVVAVNNHRVSNVNQLRAELARAGRRAAILVQRDENMSFIPLTGE